MTSRMVAVAGTVIIALAFGFLRGEQVATAKKAKAMVCSMVRHDALRPQAVCPSGDVEHEEGD